MEKLTIKQIADLFGVTVYAVQRWRERARLGETAIPFPEPCGRVASGGKPSNVYDRASVVEWGIDTGRWDEETNQPIDLKNPPSTEKV